MACSNDLISYRPKSGVGCVVCNYLYTSTIWMEGFYFVEWDYFSLISGVKYGIL